MKTNPFIKARRNSKLKTIGDMIAALVECFSADGSADIMGAYILEQAAEQAKARQPERDKEWKEIMDRIDARRKEEEAGMRHEADKARGNPVSLLEATKQKFRNHGSWIEGRSTWRLDNGWEMTVVGVDADPSFYNPHNELVSLDIAAHALRSLR